MSISENLLYRLAKRWKSPVAQRIVDFGAEPGTPEYEMAYAQRQLDLKVKNGIGIAVDGKDVLEVGCGHGGISCFLALAGARSVLGIDINTINLGYAAEFADLQSKRLTGSKLPVEFKEMRADKLELPDDTFDLVIADNVFEHFDDPEAVMREGFRVLRPGGLLFVPTFSSILSKYGLHLKNGLKMPWANLVFSEKTIVAAMHRLAEDTPYLLSVYPGLKNNPQRVKELRRYCDLNEITHGEFKRMANRCGFQMEWFRPDCTLIGRLIRKLPGLNLLSESKLIDIFSYCAGACLRKP